MDLRSLAFATNTVLAGVLLCAACTGAIQYEEGGDVPADESQAATDAGGGVSDGGGANSVEVEVSGPSIQPHVQAFANAVCGAVGSCQISTYEGHHPSADLALDILTSDTYGELPSDGNALGDAAAEYVLSQQLPAGIRYVIWRQRYNDGSGWEPMEDRGSITQNHYDHVHVGFDEVP